MGWREWTDEQWEAFVKRNQVEGGTVERVPSTVSLHCRNPACEVKLWRGDKDTEVEPLLQLCYVGDDSSSFFCVTCAKDLPRVRERKSQVRERALWMRFEPRTVMEERHG